MKATNLHSEDIKNLLDSLFGSHSSNYFDAVGQRNVPVIRFNPLKHSYSFQKDLLEKEGFLIESVGETPGFKVVSQRSSIGKSLSHFIGHIYIQDSSSMLPALMLNPKPGERVLDICAAPGSKTTQIAGMMQNRGVLVASDISSKRARSLVFNLRRMGAANTVVLKGYGEQLGNQYFETFDRVLLDPPCSALGTIHKSPEVLSWWTFERTERLQSVQKALIHSALKALRPGGILIYSTCTITSQENEEVVDYAVKNFPVELEPLEIPGFKHHPGLSRYKSLRFDPSLSQTMRIYPFDNQTEGFYIARLRKTGSFSYQRFRKPQSRTYPLCSARQDQSICDSLSFISNAFGIPEEYFEKYLYRKGANLHAVCSDLEGFPFFDQPLSAGLPIAHVRGNTPKITTEGCHLMGQLANWDVLYLSGSFELEKFVNRDPIESNWTPRHQVLVGLGDWIIGHGLIDQGYLHSRFPRIGWRFSLKSDFEPPRRQVIKSN